MSQKTQVKICGVTNEEDARWAENLGADYIGFNFCGESPRKVSAEKSGEIAQKCPPFVKKVGVFMNPQAAEIEKVLKKTQLDVLQLHGDETPEQASELKAKFQKKIWKAIRVQDEASLEKIQGFAGIADLILLDAYVPDQNGGTGKTFNWELVSKAKSFGLPIALAGGLTPENVSEAVKKTAPVVVDSASGVEKDGHPRKKDMNKMMAFIMNAKKA